MKAKQIAVLALVMAMPSLAACSPKDIGLGSAGTTAAAPATPATPSSQSPSSQSPSGSPIPAQDLDSTPSVDETPMPSLSPSAADPADPTGSGPTASLEPTAPPATTSSRAASATTTPTPSKPPTSASATASPRRTASASSSPQRSGEPTKKPTPKAQPLTLLKPGMKGEAVKTLQRKLLARGYWLSSASGTYGHTTTQAVMALQKTAGLSRDGVAGPATQRALAAGAWPRANSTSKRAIEIDKRRQILKVVRNGRVTMVFNTSTGTEREFTSEKTGRKGVAVTPKGWFRVQRQVDGWREAELGKLYRPKYFNGGIAIHGAYSIPAWPASHGCARVSVPAMDYLWNNSIAPVGTRVIVH